MNDQSKRPPRERKLVTAKGHETTQAEPHEAVSPEVGDEALLQAQLEIDDGASRSLQRSFAIAAFGGFATAVVSQITSFKELGFAGPLLAIALFYAWGVHQGFVRRTDTRQQFADSCYFLGFLLTMVAMLVGFFPAGMLGKTIESQDILRHFSMALGATALGLVCRILALQGGRSVGQVAAVVETELTKYAKKVTDEAKAMGEEIAAARETLAREREELLSLVTRDLHGVVVTAFTPIQESVSQIASELKRQSDAVAASATDVQRALATSSATLAQAATSASDAEEVVQSSQASISDALQQFSGRITTLQSEIAALVASTSGAIERMSEAFDQTAQTAPALVPAIEQTQAQMSQVAERFAVLERQSESLSADLARALSSDRGLLDEVSEAQTRLVEQFRNEAGAMGQSLASERQAAQELLRQQREALTSDQRSLANLTGEADAFHATITSATERLIGILNDFSRRLAEARQ